MANTPTRAAWQSWLILLGVIVVGCFLVASRIRPVAVVGVGIIVIALLILLRMSIETFGGHRRR